MHRKIVSLLLVLALTLSFTPVVTAVVMTAPLTQEQEANVLKDLGLFAGTNAGFELGRAPTRTEAIVLLLRMLGVAQEASDSTYTHPFKDVPSWASKYIAYAYNKGLAGGYSKTTFGGNDNATPEQFCALTLRALQYTEKDGDFVYSQSIKKAEEVSLSAAGKYKVGAKNFTRGDCVDIIYNALTVVKKTEGVTLVEYLVKKDIIDGAKAESYGLYSDKEKIRIPLRKDPATGKMAFFTADVIKQVVGAKYVSVFGTNDEISPTDYEKAYDINAYNDLVSPSKSSSLLDYFTNNHFFIDDTVKFGPKQRFVVGVYDENANMLAASVGLAKDAADKGYLEFALVNINGKDLIAAKGDKFKALFGNPVEAPNAITTIEKAKLHRVFIDNKTGKVKEEGTDSNYTYRYVIDGSQYPDLAKKAKGLNESSLSPGASALDTIMKDYKSKLSQSNFTGKFAGAYEVTDYADYTNKWTQNTSEWNNPRYVAFDDGNKPIAYTTIYPSQLKVVDVGTVKLEVYVDYVTNSIIKKVYTKMQ